jgi:site-specific recombinase XerD
MTTEISLSPRHAILSSASSDNQLVEIWLHGRSRHTQRAYAADVARFLAGAGKPLPAVTLSDLQNFADTLTDLAPATRYRILSAVKSLLAFGHRIGYLPFDVGRALRLAERQGRCARDVHRHVDSDDRDSPREQPGSCFIYANSIQCQ